MRRASREGKVRTELAIDFEARPVRLINFQSALKYWGKHRSIDYDRSLSEMRRGAPVFEDRGWHSGDGTPVVLKRYLVLHPWALILTHPLDPDAPETWFKWDK